MHIYQYHINNLNNPTNQTNFDGKLPKKIFSDIRDIPKLNCAICGDNVISLPERDIFLDKFTAGSKKTLENPIFDEFRQSNIFKFLKNLSKKHPNMPLQKIVNKDLVKAKISRFGQFDQNQVKEIVDISNTFTQNAPQVIKKLYPLRERMPDEYKEFLDYMYIYSLKYPKNTFSEIFNKNEVWEYHNQLRTLRKEQFFRLKDHINENLTNLREKLPEKNVEEFKKFQTKALSIASALYLPAKSKKIMLEVLCKDFLNNLEDKTLARQIKQQIDSLPLNNHKGDDLVIQSLNLNDREIIKNIIDNLSSTFEHIVLASQNGSRGKSNGICLCRKCNQTRATIPYPVIMEYFPKFQENLQKQMDRVMSFIKNGKLKHYETYPQKVKKTLLEVTDQKLRINIKKFLKEKAKEAQLKLDSTKAALADNQKLYNETESTLKEKQKSINNLYKEIKTLKKDKEFLENIQAQNNKRLKDLKNDLKVQENYNQEISKALEEDI